MTDPVSQRYKEALQLGHVAVARGRPREAIAHYRDAAGLAPDRALPHVRVGEIQLQLEDPSAALAAFDQALARAPSDLAALQGRAAALRAMGDVAGAKASQTQLDRLQADLRAAHGAALAADPRSAQIERHIENGAAARAAGDLATAAQAYLTAANGYVATGVPDAAIDACLRGLEAQPGNIDIHFVLTMLYLRRGWIELGVERALLIERRLDIDDDPRRRVALARLASDFRSTSPELERLAVQAG
jgi:tetratricopeptide (TPR) repeat protein